MIEPPKNYNDKISELFGGSVINFTFQVTEDCNLCCTYCYQTDKTKRRMTLETAKKTFDFIMSEAEKEDSVLSYTKNIGIIFDYIGGEPFLEADLIYEFIKYVETRLVELDSPWLLFHKHSFSTNGTLYFTDKVQKIMGDFNTLLSVGVTVDGCKEIHDACRVFPNGEGSYDLAIKAALMELKKDACTGTKITLSPYNVKWTSKAIINMLSLGFKIIHANCAFEEGWSKEDSLTLFDELVKVADYVNEHPDCYVSLLDDFKYRPYDDNNDQNWCGGTGKMLAVDCDGIIYPCVRYMPTSLGNKVKPIIVGSIDSGVYTSCEACKIFEEFSKVTRTSQSTDECNNCKVGRGCSWCSAFNYQTFGTFNKRATFICDMHKAAAAATYYFTGETYLDENELINIIGEERYYGLLNMRR